jgi:hypothetical protein
MIIGIPVQAEHETSNGVEAETIFVSCLSLRYQ